MSTWIFQGHPSRYDVADPTVFAAGGTEVWLVSRYRDRMEPGDIVYMWRAGDVAGRGLYGWGTTQGKPDYYDNWGWGISIAYTTRFPHHIPSTVLQNDPALASAFHQFIARLLAERLSDNSRTIQALCG